MPLVSQCQEVRNSNLDTISKVVWHRRLACVLMWHRRLGGAPRARRPWHTHRRDAGATVLRWFRRHGSETQPRCAPRVTAAWRAAFRVFWHSWSASLPFSSVAWPTWPRRGRPWRLFSQKFSPSPSRSPAPPLGRRPAGRSARGNGRAADVVHARPVAELDRLPGRRRARRRCRPSDPAAARGPCSIAIWISSPTPVLVDRLERVGRRGCFFSR